jgi:hypothetical protein
MSELVLVDTENVGYNIIKTLDMEKVKKLILVDGSREENIRLSADILQTLLEYSNKGKIERIYTDKKEKNAADYLLILKIGMIISENSSNKSNIVIKILSGDKIFETIARILKEMNYNTEIGNIHNEKRQNKISVQSNVKSNVKSIKQSKQPKQPKQPKQDMVSTNIDTYIKFENIDFYSLGDNLKVDDILKQLEILWSEERTIILENLNAKKENGLKFSIRNAIRKHPQYLTHNDEYISFKEI